MGRNRYVFVYDRSTEEFPERYLLVKAYFDVLAIRERADLSGLMIERRADVLTEALGATYPAPRYEVHTGRADSWKHARGAFQSRSGGSRDA